MKTLNTIIKEIRPKLTAYCEQYYNTPFQQDVLSKYIQNFSPGKIYFKHLYLQKSERNITFHVVFDRGTDYPTFTGMLILYWDDFHGWCVERQ